MSIQEEIKSIISRRKSKIPFLTKKRERIVAITEIVRDIDAIRLRMLDHAEQSDVKQKIFALSTAEYMLAEEKVMKAYSNIIERFSRDEISIAVVGAARQGKSKLLQSISNLDDSVIPAFISDDCTGAASVIKNVPGIAVKAEITFRDQQDMVRIVQKYLDTIFGVGKHVLGSFSEISSLDIGKLRSEIPTGSGKISKFEHLEKYIREFLVWSKHVNTGKVVVHDPLEIQKYVAQHNDKSENDSERKNYYDYLAVKEAVISCEFRNVDAGSIVLRDTIGLGDTSLEIKDKMLEAIGVHSDAAIVVRRPEVGTGKFDDSDNQLYDQLNDAFEKRHMEKWLFWLINKTTGSSPYGDNSDRCTAFEQRLKAQNWNIAGAYIVDVSNENEVNNQFLISVLQELIKNIDYIDEGILQEIQVLSEKLYEEYRKLQEAIREILVQGAGAEIDSKEFLNSRWRIFYRQQFMKALKDYHKKLKEKSNQECKEFKEYIEKILQDSVSMIPTVQKFEYELAGGGRSKAPQVYMEQIDILRTNFTEQFLKIDEDVFNDKVREFKGQVIDLLAGKDVGMLGNLLPLDEFEDKTEWLEKFAEKYFVKERYAQFKTAFLHLFNFQLSVRGFLMHKIRSRIDRLEDMGYITRESSDDAIALELNRLFQRKLKDLREELVYLFRDELFSDPNRIFYAEMGEFYDRLNFSFTKTTCLDSEITWRDFYGDYLHEIWMDEFSDTMKKSAVFQEWFRLSDSLANVKKEDFLG